MMHFKEHTGLAGRLHLNVLWDWPWLNQRELSTLAAVWGFGSICHISHVGRPIELAQGRLGSSAPGPLFHSASAWLPTCARPAGGLPPAVVTLGRAACGAGAQAAPQPLRWGGARIILTGTGRPEV
jgi:hypothetical protein